MLLLSNSPRPRDSVAEQLERIGVPRSSWDVIVSSGDVARTLIASYAGKAIVHLGPERDLPIFAGIDVERVGPERAAAVVCTGLFDDERETPDDYADTLAACTRYGLPMICANPDVAVERGGRIVYCAGALARAYEQLGGAVAYAGKPYAPIYELAFTTLETLAAGKCQARRPARHRRRGQHRHRRRRCRRRPLGLRCERRARDEGSRCCRARRLVSARRAAARRGYGKACLVAADLLEAAEERGSLNMPQALA